MLAGVFEIGWPVGLKMAQVPATRWTEIAMGVVFMGVTGALLQRTIPIGTAYAVWTGIGAAGTSWLGCWSTATQPRWRDTLAWC